MRACIQRVSQASVTVGGRVAGQIGQGLVVLLGVAAGDVEQDARWLADKIVPLRIFNDEQGKMNRSLMDVNGALLVVSQFTLLADCRKGRRPSLIDAAAPELAEHLYECFMAAVAAYGVRVASGEFGAMMQVALVNDGPVTVLLDSKKTF
jgi:D-tyrosyl-tRNA(Tyr) deacylase